MDDLLQEFIAETRETLSAIAGEIVAWEAEPADRGRLDAIFRFVHTVKGSCGFLDLPRIERLSHAAEERLATVRDGRSAPDAALVNCVLATVDRIALLVDALETGESLAEEADEHLIAALAGESGGGDASLRRPGGGQRTVSRTIRLSIDLLDRLMGGVSDMVLARNDLARRLRDAGGDGAVEAAFERLSLSIAEIRDTITRTRMQRLDNVFATLPRLVRDLAADLGKMAVIEVDGGDVELDREMIEMIRDPLVHIIRNAVDHGIETPDHRRAAGKSAAGRLTVRASQAGNQISIEIADDGRGVDGDALVARAMAAGLLDPDRARQLGWAQKLALVFAPGLSTSSAITAISGRGVGMDVVRSNIERIGGLIDIESQPGKGMRLALRVPLTLTIIPALTIGVADQCFAIPRSAIEEIVRASGAGVRVESIGGTQVATIRGQRMPVVAFDRLIGVGAGPPAILVILKPAGGECFALAVDMVHDHEELVVKPAAPAVMATGLYAGTTLPDTGQPMLLLDPAGIATLAGVLRQADAREAAAPEPVEQSGPMHVPTLLFRDLCGAERAIRLGVVERIEEVAASAVRPSAGRLRLVHEGRLVPLLTCGETIAGPRLRVLRLSDGATSLAYAIDEVIDIVALPESGMPAADPGLISGVVLVDDRPVELIDPYWLFAEAGDGEVAGDRRPLCLLGAEGDPWTREILRPLVEAAGYRVVHAGPGQTMRPDLVIDNGDGAPLSAGPGTPVVRLRRAQAVTPGEEGSVYRYDREGLLAALRAHRREG
ncbi:MAG TPA: chemotaxis protein CheW [Sphingomonadaceae bacterium]|nr:chemotaxis protein CheW [Sphingomonadaceae bacterium]